MTFAPRLDILPPAQRALWQELSAVPRHFVLRVGEPELTTDQIIDVASLLDLAGTKIKALLARVEAKDYRDIAALLRHGVSLRQILAAGSALFGNAFTPLVAQKALAYFKGGDLDTLDEPTRALLIHEAIADLEVTATPIASPRLDR